MSEIMNERKGGAREAGSEAMNEREGGREGGREGEVREAGSE